MLWIRFGRWSSAHGMFFSSTRLYAGSPDGKYHFWTPFVMVTKRYSSWLGYWATPQAD